MRSRKLNGRQLRAIREDRALTLLQLAAKVGEAVGGTVAESTVCKWELGERQPNPLHFRGLCTALEVGKEELLEAEAEQVAS